MGTKETAIHYTVMPRHEERLAPDGWRARHGNAGNTGNVIQPGDEMKKKFEAATVDLERLLLEAAFDNGSVVAHAVSSMTEDMFEDGGNEYREVQVIEANHNSITGLMNLDNDAALEYELYDFAFAYWHECFAFSPAPRVVLDYCDGRYRPSLELMRKPGLSGRELSAIAESITRGAWDTVEWPPIRHWATMLELLCSGNGSQVWRLVELSWLDEKGEAGRMRFVAEFSNGVRRGRYWHAIGENKICQKDENGFSAAARR